MEGGSCWSGEWCVWFFKWVGLGGFILCCVWGRVVRGGVGVTGCEMGGSVCGWMGDIALVWLCVRTLFVSRVYWGGRGSDSVGRGGCGGGGGVWYMMMSEGYCLVLGLGCL